MSKKNKGGSVKKTQVSAEKPSKSSTQSADKSSVFANPLQFSMHEKFADIFVISMFAIFPFYMTNKLFNVRGDRLHYFVATSFILLFFILATYICGIDKDRWPKEVFRMSVTDWSFIVFTVVCLISACLSKYGSEAFTGSGGRDSGFWLMAMYFLCYFMVSRYFRYSEVLFTVFAVASSVVCFIALLNEFFIDPFKLIEDIKETQQKDFITTIGNINMFSGFVCVSLPVCAALAVISKDKLSTAFYCVTVGLNFIGLLTANSLSGYFGLMAFMAVLFVYCCGSAERIFKFFLVCFTIALSSKVLRLISLIFHDNYKNLQDASKFVIFDNRTYIAIVVFAVLTAASYLLYRKKGDERSPKWVQIAAGCFVGLIAASVLFAFIYFSAIDKETNLGSLGKILRLNDKWGTHRGYAWIRGFILFKSNGIKNILVGSGPDTFGQLIKEVYREDMLNRHGSIFDTAHNEFLNYLVTTGILGFGAYVTIIISLLVKCIRRCKINPAFIIAIVAIVSYCSQSMFSLATPIITPYVFLFFGIAQGMIRRADISGEV